MTHSKQSQQASEEAARQVAIHKRALVTAANEKETLAERLAQTERQLRTLQKEREAGHGTEGDDNREARWLKQIETERVAAVKVRLLRDWIFVSPLSSYKYDHPNACVLACQLYHRIHTCSGLGGAAKRIWRGCGRWWMLQDKAAAVGKLELELEKMREKQTYLANELAVAVRELDAAEA